MNERSTTDIYERLSPSERNMQLRGLYQQLPLEAASLSREFLPADPLEAMQETIRMIADRYGSEYHNALFAKLEELLSYAYNRKLQRSYYPNFRRFVCYLRSRRA